MTEIDRNIKTVQRWEQLYNESHEQMVDECYAADLEARAVGLGAVIRGREQLRQAAGAVLQIAPRRRMRVDRVHPSGNVVVVEATLLDPDQGPDWQSPFCSVLTFRDGKIVSDRTYLDVTRWPGINQALAHGS
jgi:ketosteroid isomerase-like protein